MTKKYFLPIFVLLSSLASASQETATINSGLRPLIIGGQEVASNDPIALSTVLIIGKIQRATFMCSGVIIDQDMILTAGHCLGGGGYATLNIYFRTQQNGTGPVIAGAGQVRMRDTNPDSEFDWDDVAVVKLASPIPKNYIPAQLIPNQDLLQNGGSVILAGFGRTVATAPSNGTDGAGTLRKVGQIILQAKYTQKEILISLKDKGACAGDSGGPAFIEEKGTLFLAGIASRMTEKDLIPGTAPKKQYSCTVDMVYSNVLSQIDWIKNAMAELRKSN